MEAQTAAPAAEQAPASIENTMGEVFEKLNPPRSESGQYAAKETPVESAPEVATEQATDQTPVEVASEPAKPAIPRPQSWSSDYDDWWNALPPERQEFLSKRESEAHKKITEQGEAIKSVEPIRQAFEPLRQIAQRNRVSESDLVQRFVSANEALERDPVSAIKWLADSYRVDLSQFARPVTGEQTPDSAQINALNQEIARLRQEVGETKSTISAREQREAEAQSTSLAKLIEDFKKDKSDHWEDIKADVIQQAFAIEAVTPDMPHKELLEQAYSRAIKLNDNVSKKLNESKLKAEAEKKAAEDKRKADEAKRLASLNAKSQSGKSPSPAGQTWEQEMAQVYEKVTARA